MQYTECSGGLRTRTDSVGREKKTLKMVDRMTASESRVSYKKLAVGSECQKLGIKDGIRQI